MRPTIGSVAISNHALRGHLAQLHAGIDRLKTEVDLI
jgi:hypothetical protein